MLDSLVRVSRRVLKVPKAIASQIGVLKEDEVCPTTHSQQPPGDGTGTRSDHRRDESACRRADAEQAAASRHLYTVERADRETPRVRSETANRPNGLHRGPQTGTQRIATSYRGRSARVRSQFGGRKAQTTRTPSVTRPPSATIETR
ncbi:hypothetical protein Zmor_004185 [Zophobas morio]|uniref:Uncharacterized protein n=1 Tax=Zophobas morio TaxID=2755281 RepID=A0AA38HK68_9CUCU|nr:hypothetical protein Zmor_004168 [Zophobas morio]KAJ3639110.1 hypothetical protein Zmor_004173 [Zophobas morio]KAJ3639115.1 hypothetical protein Zmor_004178 [Zophobas morio]KAJ3639122.1 hypothetical protein Zmor_004185 [Zophobas morio]